MKVPVNINAQKLVLIIFSFFIILDGNSKLLSESSNDYLNVTRYNHSNFLEKNENSIYDYSKRGSVFEISENEKIEILSDSLQLEVGKMVQIVAESEIGYLFNHWTINGKFLSSAIEYEFVMPSDDAIIIGHFDKIGLPTINITSPIVNSSFLPGEKVFISADVSSDKGKITKVDFFVDNILLASLNNAPYEFTLENASLGEHKVVVKALDNSGQVSTSSVRSFIVADKANVAPNVSISGPSANSQFIQGDNISITANAADTDGTIAKVEFYNGNNLLGTDTAAPYSFAWSNVSVGNFSLTAKATDDKGAVTVSDPVVINVVEKENVSSTPIEGTGLLDGLVAFYEMNTNLSGALKDSHGENHGTSTQITHVNGFNDKGNKYDGASSISSVPNSNSLNLTTEFTLMADIFREGNGQGSSSIIIGKTFSSAWPENQTYSMAITKDNKIKIRTNTTGLNDWVSTKIVPTGKWVRVIATYKSGEGYSLYFDTVYPEKSSQISGSIAKSDLELTIGSATLINNAAYARRFEGILDNVGIWNRQLSQAEIEDLITTKITYPDFGGAQGANVAPSVSITSPSANAQFTQGDNISITANAADTDGTIAKVEFYNGNNLLGTDTTAPYSFAWPNLSVGSFTLTAKATDNEGTVTVSDPVSINIVEKANVAPSVSITSPSANAQFIQGDNISITANAADTDGTITKVEFYNGNNLLGTDTTAPYSFAWSNLSVGSFTLTAKATDNKGTVTVSDPVSINVVEKANVAPSVSITSPSANAQFIQGDNISITANAADTDGTITKVEFYNGNNLLGTDTTAPFSFSWSNLSVGSFTLTAKATDNKGTVTVSNPVSINVVEKANVAPSVSITSPSANAQFTQGDNLTITANAADTDGTITKVEFYNGNNLLGTDTTAPYSFAWPNLSVGSFALTAKATDNKGTATVSAVVSINVVEKPNVAPSVSITSPIANAQFTQGDNISITANAADTDGTITKVEFYNGNNLLGTDTTAPYSFAWSNLSVGNFTLTAKATDNKGTVTVSDPVSINVVEKANVAPSVSITSPSANSQFIQGDNISITANAADTDGTIAKVEFYNGNNLLGTDTTAPYSFAWSNVTVGSFNLTAKATDNKGIASVSAVVSINVVEKPNVAPSVSITSPSANAQFIQGDNISITANAADTDGTISKVEFYNGNNLLGTDTTAPYSFSWSNLSVGSFTLTAKATDNKGAVTVSSGITIEVKEKEIPVEIVIPGIILVTPIQNQEFDEGENIELMVMFEGSDESVKEVEYYSGDQLIGFSTVSPFGFTWQNSSIGQHSITAKAIGEDPNKFKISESVSIQIKKINQKVFQIIDPIKNTVFNNGDDITISVEIPEYSKAIMRVDYLRGNTRLGSTTVAPYDYIWKNSSHGNHDLSAQLIFMDGTKIISNVVPIKVLKKNQAVVKLLSPNNKKELLKGENLSLNVELLEFENKVTTVEYLLNGKKLGESTTQPFDFTWENIPEGEHQLMARAIEENGLYVYSEPTILSAREDIKNIQLEYVIGPNPTTDYLNVIFKNLDGIYDFEFRIISMNGTVQRTIKARPEDSKVTINVSDLRNGVYVLQLTSNGNNISSKKFIKE